jgi:hypothetical protein
MNLISEAGVTAPLTTSLGNSHVQFMMTSLGEDPAAWALPSL